MGLEVYYPTDVRNALLAAEQAVNAMADAAAVGMGQDDVDCSQSAFTAGFLTGYRAALTTLALAFGLGLKALSGRPEPPLEEQKTAFLAVTPPSLRQRRC